MLRLAVFSLISLLVIVSCMGQTFQYSRGWTNGKRSSSHLHEDPAITEMFGAQESERRLEKCIIQLQRLIHNPYLIQQSYPSNPNGILFSNGNDGISNNNRHQSNEIFDNSASASGEYSAKHNN